MSTRPGLHLAIAAVLLVAGCATAGPIPSPSASPAAAPSVGPSSTPSPTPAASSDPWVADLAKLDEAVRRDHPDPFANHPESEWTATLAGLPGLLAGATPEQQLVRLSSLVGLLDTHSYLAPPFDFHVYRILFYPFADGWYVIRAADPSLVGSRLISINGTTAADAEAVFRPLLPADNESGTLDAIEGPMVYVEWLVGAGIVDDPAKPGYLLERPDGTQVTVNPEAMEEAAWGDVFGVVGDLIGDAPAAPEAVARRTEAAWTALDKGSRTFVLHYNDYEDVLLPKAIAAMEQALDDGTATRVALDMRYLRGGNGSLAQPLIEALGTDPRFDRAGTLVVLTGRENVSAGTLTAAQIEEQTAAVFVGEPTPARADNFLCQCKETRLTHSGFVISVPTYTRHTGDPRDAIRPDLPMALPAADFFAGKDPVLDAVIGGAGFAAAP